MLKRPVAFIKRHIVQNKLYYIISLSALALGIAAGVFTGLDYTEGNGGLLSGFFAGLSGFSSKGLLYEGALQTAVFTGMVIVFGLSPIGSLLVSCLCAYKGFALGFSAGAVYSVYKIRALVFVVLGLLPSCIIWLPMFVFTSVYAIKCSFGMLKMLSKRGNADTRDDMAALLFTAVIMFICMFFSKIVEIYFVPSVLNVVGGIYL